MACVDAVGVPVWAIAAGEERGGAMVDECVERRLGFSHEPARGGETEYIL